MGERRPTSEQRTGAGRPVAEVKGIEPGRTYFTALRKWVDLANLTHAELAERITCAPSTLSQLLGNRGPAAGTNTALDWAKQIIEACGGTEQDLANWTAFHYEVIKYDGHAVDKLPSPPEPGDKYEGSSEQSTPAVETTPLVEPASTLPIAGRLRRRLTWVGPALAALVVALIGTINGLFGAGAQHLWYATLDAFSGNPPVRVTLKIDTAEHVMDRTQVLPRPLSQTGKSVADLEPLVGKYPDIGAFRYWVRSEGGADPDRSVIKLVVEGMQRSATVRILDMKADIRKRSEPLTGTLFYDFFDGHEPLTRVGFNLDETSPPAREIADREQLGRPYFGAIATKTLTFGESEVFEITAVTEEHYVEWCVELDLLIDGQVTTETACPDDGLPIRTTARAVTFDEGKGPFSAYGEMYRWSKNPTFLKVDPNTEEPI